MKKKKVQSVSDAACSTDGLYAVILAGGSGTRLWPLSRTLLPKQLLALNGKDSLLQQTAARVLAALPPERILTVTNEEQVFEVRDQLDRRSPGLAAGVLSEPAGKNTLPALLLALDRIVAVAPEAVVAVFPADHTIGDEDAWRSDLLAAAGLARQGWFVTFGIKPDKPETGYGYIALGEEIGPDTFNGAGFIEKPGLAKAEEYLRSGKYLWNSGMFVLKADALLEAVARHQPVLDAWWQARSEAPLAAGYSAIPDISIDYGVMEKVDRIAVIRAHFAWDDLGNWEALHRLGDKDENGCMVQGDVLAMSCADSLLISRGGKLAAVGVDNMIVVQTRDATLVCPMSKVQQVKDVVNSLKREGSNLVEAHVTVRRPWGEYTVLEEGPFYKIKRIVVYPGARLSRQMHHHRSEHWVVIKGTALVEVNEKEILLAENQSVDIPKTATHRLANPGKVDVEIIEIQSGPYLEEDDIVRFDDVYGRK